MVITQTQTSYFMILTGLLCIAAGIIVLRVKYSKLKKLTMSVTARVADFIKEERTEWKDDSDGTKRSRSWTVDKLILEYEAGGRVYRKPFAVSEISFAPVSARRKQVIRVGETLKIFCNPEDPSEFRYRSRPTGLFFTVAAIVMGGGIALIGILNLVG